MNQTVEIDTQTNIVRRLFRRIPGVNYSASQGGILIDLPLTTYVDAGFTAHSSEEGWTFIPPSFEEPTIDPVQELAALRTEHAQIGERIAQLESIILGG